MQQKPAVKQRKSKNDVTKAINPLDQPDRFKLGSMGYLGLNIFNGVTNDELKKELNFPCSINTYKQMSYHSTVNSALALFDNLISKASWEFKPPANATQAELKQVKIINEMMSDLDGQSWAEFISDALSANTFGFSVHEKVYRKRLKANGSKYDDGVIAWKKLAIRSQETIERFVFSDDGNDIIGVRQNISSVNDPYNRYTNRSANAVVLPRNKFMLFRAGKHRGDPYGKSPLRDAYLAWRFLSVIEEIEANGVAKDLTGIPVLSIPPQYMAADATAEQKATMQYYERAMQNLQMNQQSAMILPQASDDLGKPLFKLELLSLAGSKAIDTTKIKEYYKSLILISLFADLLALGSTSTGSFALGSLKQSLSGSVADAMIKRICDVINTDLIYQTYSLNGWDTARMGTMDYDGLEADSLEDLSKAYQRIAAVGFLPRTHNVVNKALTSLGVDPLSADTNLDDVLGEMTSKSGQGMQEGLPSGTGSAVAADANSGLNMDNVA